MLLLDKNMTLEMSIRPSFGEQGELSVELPSWKESKEFLSPNQKKAAEMVFTKNLLLGAFKNARRMLPELRAQDLADPSLPNRVSKKNDEDLLYRHVFGLLDASDTVQKGNLAKTEFEIGHSTWGDKGAGLISSVEPLVAGKDKVYSDAKNWNEEDILREANKAYEYMTTVPKSFKTDMYKKLGLEPETMKHKAKRWGPTIVNTAVSFASSEGLPTLGGVAVAAVHPLKDAPLWVDVLAGGSSYALWIRKLIRAGYENVLLLDKTGHASNVFAKSAYEKYPDNRKRQIRSTIWGTAKPDMGAEGYHYLVAGGIALLAREPVTALEYIAVANYVAAGEKALQVEISKHARTEGKGWHRTLVKGIARSEGEKIAGYYHKVKNITRRTSAHK
jgi:hypothetical protein